MNWRDHDEQGSALPARTGGAIGEWVIEQHLSSRSFWVGCRFVFADLRFEAEILKSHT
jgi:hypothetical protein